MKPDSTARHTPAAVVAAEVHTPGTVLILHCRSWVLEQPRHRGLGPSWSPMSLYQLPGRFLSPGKYASCCPWCCPHYEEQCLQPGRDCGQQWLCWVCFSMMHFHGSLYPWRDVLQLGVVLEGGPVEGDSVSARWGFFYILAANSTLLLGKQNVPEEGLSVGTHPPQEASRCLAHLFLALWLTVGHFHPLDNSCGDQTPNRFFFFNPKYLSSKLG